MLMRYSVLLIGLGQNTGSIDYFPHNLLLVCLATAAASGRLFKFKAVSTFAGGVYHGHPNIQEPCEGVFCP